MGQETRRRLGGAWTGAVAVEEETFMRDAYLEEKRETELSMTRPGSLDGGGVGWGGCPEMGLGRGAGMGADAKGSLDAVR